jgi:hypothetical protein
MTGIPEKYVRTDWFGPEGFVAAVLAMLSISLPYTGLVPRDAIWFIAGPLVAGLLFIALSAAGFSFSTSLRRLGVGSLAAFAGFICSIAGFLLGIAAGGIFT